MAKTNVLVELLETPTPGLQAFALFEEARSGRAPRSVQEAVAGLNAEIDDDLPPVPMLSSRPALTESTRATLRGFSPNALSSYQAAVAPADLPAEAVVVPVRIEEEKLPQLRERSGIKVWPNSTITLMQEHARPPAPQLALSSATADCSFGNPATIAQVQQALKLQSMWAAGFDGTDMVIGIVDQGVNAHYPVIGGYAPPGSPQPGTAPITSHGSMCAADVLVAAPKAKLYDYPFLGHPNSGGALAMFQAALSQRRLNGTPHLLNNSWGYVGVPPKAAAPDHEVHDINHPVHRKVRELVAAGIHVFFAAGNCGGPCPSGSCQPSGTGPGKSIHAANSLEEVITVAAVNIGGTRIGYSSQGPGMFKREKPDISCYSHFFANFGPGRPGGMAQPFDNGTSAATPLACGTAALLVQAFPSVTPRQLGLALVSTAGGNNWSADLGYGIIDINAARTYLGSIT